MSPINQATSKIIADLFPFWSKLDSKTQTDVLTQGQYIKLSAEQFICLEGDMCDRLPLIISGSARIYKTADSGREITLYHLDQGDSCIMTASCIISQQVFPAFAITETEVEAIAIPAHSLRKWIIHDPIWQEYIFGLLSQRLAEVIEIVEEVAFRRMDSRIALYLISNCDRHSNSIQITHEAIAQDLGSSREVISRILKTFEKQKLLSLSRGKIKIINREQLRKITLSSTEVV